MTKVDAVELLTTDDDGNAIEGPKYPRDLGVARYIDEPGNDGQPMPETLVEFYVPDRLCDGASPSDQALRLVAQRMGWEPGGDR